MKLWWFYRIPMEGGLLYLSDEHDLEKNIKSKRMEEELEGLTSRLHSTKRDFVECKEQLEDEKWRVEQAEAAIVDAKTQSEQDQKSWEYELLQKLEEERNKCRTELAQHANGYVRGTQSPSCTNRQCSNADLIALQNPGTPSVHTAEPKFFDGVTSPAIELVLPLLHLCPRPITLLLPTTLSAQRDEAWEEVVSLMCEVEQKRAADEKVKELEEEMSKMSGRYEIALEMLGEKSEIVEKLRADVAELKQMCRELVISTTE
ncbi:hypothetical protein GP486_000179 [Trichoglossum hirsutum]|uniref:TATA element modulatory factor 1 TATA binding domain-containing protein n=1 Tax=Trichoglossum hirsutum TaxID=265104 RepID=A0A9P8RTW9_9PEZI|nr:hypothetical protein GP486_000179 [Trichoglossum hirsutum]